jgi:hypothetical protein
MAVDRRYFFDWIAPVNGHRYRVVITPWGYQTLDVTASQPAFGAGASGDYYPIPKGVIPMGEIKPVAQFDELPIGLMDSPGMSLTLDYAPLGMLIEEGNSDLADLWSALQEPEFIPTGNLTVDDDYDGPDPWIVLTPLEGVKIRTGNYFELLTDAGDSSLGIGTFKVIGAWVQHIVDEPEESYNPLTGSDRLKIELTGAFRYAAEVVTPSMIGVVTRVIGDTNAEYAPYLVDLIYGEGDYMRTLGDFFGAGSGAQPYRRYLMFRLVDLLDSMELLIQQVYARLMRAEVSFTINGILGSLRMFDWVDLRQQDESSDTGEASSTSVAEPYFPGLVDWSNDEGLFVDGWLHEVSDAGKDRLFGYPSAYELLKGMCEGTGVIGVLNFAGDATYRESPILYTVGLLGDGGSDLDVDENDFKGDAWVMRRSRRLTAARADLVGTGSGDVNEVTYRSRAVANDSPRLIPVVFNCIPLCGEREDFSFRTQGSGDPHIVESPLNSYNTLFYKAGTASFFRCHHYVGLAPSVTGGTPNFNYYTFNGLTLPLPSGHTRDEFWYPLRLAMLEIQKSGGLSYAVATFAVSMFGHQHQTLYPTTVAIEKALPGYIGLQAGFADGSALTGESRHATYPGYPLLIRTELDIAAGTSAIELLAPGGLS